MSEPFKVQISSDLIRRLLGEGDQKPIRKPTPKVVRPEHPSNQGPRIEPKVTEEAGGWQPGLPSLLPLGVFPPVADKELDPIRKVLDESEGVMDKLQKEEARVLEKVKHNAEELREKEYKMPEQRTIPCLSAKDACIQCYKDHPEDPLQCAEAVKFFQDCARRVQQQFVTSG
uniref:CHCH domain-containing protein n=1 Tax=Picea sitchensis TaxID=3332 RepID=A9NSL9_PICSI|nr:unknown [Picea sitchensis]